MICIYCGKWVGKAVNDNSSIETAICADCFNILKSKEGDVPLPECDHDDCGRYCNKLNKQPGMKNDKGKTQWHLLPWEAMEEVVKVLMEGAKLYGDDNWKHVEGLRERYTDAMIRHAVAYQKGQDRDPQFNYSHMAHAICCGLFALWEEQNARKANQSHSELPPPL